MSRFSYKHDVCLSVGLSICLSVTLVDWITWRDKSGNRHLTGEIDFLAYLNAKADPDRIIK